jgi:arylsulfatase A-like enzyme
MPWSYHNETEIATMRTASLLLTILLFTSVSEHAHAADKPNIIVILADDMGYGDAGFNGCTDIPTPAMDSIAANGIRFTDGYVMAPQCGPSRSALLSGRDQNRILANNNMTLDLIGLPAGRTFADRMKAAGYRTGIVGKWHLGADKGKQPLDRGFDEFFGFLGGSSFYFAPGNRDSISNLLEGREPVKVDRYLTDAFGDRAVDASDFTRPTADCVGRRRRADPKRTRGRELVARIAGPGRLSPAELELHVYLLA